MKRKPTVLTCNCKKCGKKRYFLLSKDANTYVCTVCKEPLSEPIRKGVDVSK